MTELGLILFVITTITHFDPAAFKYKSHVGQML